jgi:hypothetical protein
MIYGRQLENRTDYFGNSLNNDFGVLAFKGGTHYAEVRRSESAGKGVMRPFPAVHQLLSESTETADGVNEVRHNGRMPAVIEGAKCPEYEPQPSEGGEVPHSARAA